MKSIEKVEITVEELKTLNALILQLFDVSEFTLKVANRVEEVVNNAPLEYVDEEGNVSLDKETLIDQAIETEFGNEFDTFVPTIIYETVHEKFNDSIWDGLEDLIRVVYQEEVEFNRDPLGYHGMSERDFL